MANTDFHFDGLDELEQGLARMVAQDFPEEFKKLVLMVAYELQGRLKINTPKKTGRAADSWTVGEIVKRGDEYVVEVYSNVEYINPLNYGHRDRGGGFVPGVHMLEISLEEVGRVLPDYLRDWLSTFVSTHDL